MQNNGINRFSIKADIYNKYRPKYPLQVIRFIEDVFKQINNIIVADVGSGTGIFTKQILPFCKLVYGIEPNERMRKVAENMLLKKNNFISIDGRAECTNLTDNSIDCITVSQAFHWFDKKKCKLEFRRILNKDGFVILLWNKRLQNESEHQFLLEFDEILKKFGTGYNNKPLKINFDEIKEFFRDGYFTTLKSDNSYYMDFQQLLGTLLSSSYIQELQENKKKELNKSAKNLFNNYQINNKILFQYESVLFIGKI